MVIWYSAKANRTRGAPICMSRWALQFFFYINLNSIIIEIFTDRIFDITSWEPSNAGNFTIGGGVFCFLPRCLCTMHQWNRNRSNVRSVIQTKGFSCFASPRFAWLETHAEPLLGSSTFGFHSLCPGLLPLIDSFHCCEVVERKNVLNASIIFGNVLLDAFPGLFHDHWLFCNIRGYQSIPDGTNDCHWSVIASNSTFDVRTTIITPPQFRNPTTPGTL